MKRYKVSEPVQRSEEMKVIQSLLLSADSSSRMDAREFSSMDACDRVLHEMKNNIFKLPTMTIDNITLPTTQTGPRARLCFCWNANDSGLRTNTVVNGMMEEIFGGDSYTFCGPVVMFYVSKDGRRMSAGIKTVEDLNMVVQDIKQAIQTENLAVGRAEAFAG